MLYVLWILKNKRTEDWITVARFPAFTSLMPRIVDGNPAPPWPCKSYYKDMGPPEGWDLIVMGGGGAAGYYPYDKLGLDRGKERKIEYFGPAERRDILEFQKKMGFIRKERVSSEGDEVEASH